mgnify:CR=1 FL=1|tara:strand:+ start:180 stop:434 length:255 start_codon:yes stop_codon:yes gene_type:complete
MPKYAYKCKECDQSFEVYHSIKNKLNDCQECETKNSLIRVPSDFFTHVRDSQQVGSVVKTSIEEFRSDLKEEKQRLSQKEYKND